MNGMKTLEKYFKVKEIMETVKADKIDVDRSTSWLTIEGKRNENNMESRFFVCHFYIISLQKGDTYPPGNFYRKRRSSIRTYWKKHKRGNPLLCTTKDCRTLQSAGWTYYSWVLKLYE